MASLSGATIESSFKSLLKLAGNTDDLVTYASGAGKQVMTGDGEDTPIYLNTNAIGIGTSVPGIRYHQKMDIATTSTEGTSPDQPLGGISLSLYSATTTHSVLLDLKKSRHTTLGEHTTVVDDELIGQVQFLGSDGTTFEACANIKAEIDGSVTATAMPGRLIFQTTPASNTLTTRMTIDNAGVITPGADNTQSLGTASLRWSDMRATLVNGADIVMQSSSGNWTLREGHDCIYACNNEMGQKGVRDSGQWYKINMTAIDSTDAPAMSEDVKKAYEISDNI